MQRVRPWYTMPCHTPLMRYYEKLAAFLMDTGVKTTTAQQTVFLNQTQFNTTEHSTLLYRTHEQADFAEPHNRR